MVSFNFWSNATSQAVQSNSSDTQKAPSPDSHLDTQAALGVSKSTVPVQTSPVEDQPQGLSVPNFVSEPVPPSRASAIERPNRRSFNPFQRHTERKPMMTTEQEQKKERRVVEEVKHAAVLDAPSSRSNKRAKQSAEIVRSLIIGPTSISPVSKKTRPLSRTQLNKVKSDLAKPKSANRVIAQLRQLDLNSSSSSSLILAQPRSKGPIHAVCLDSSEEDIGKRHFSRLEVEQGPADVTTREIISPSIVTASAESLTSILGDMRVVSLMSGDFGLGEPGDGPGILSGALPTAETIITGIETITPQLMALGFATGKSIMPDHTGVYPPTDRISVLTYWWGLEVVLPPPSLAYLDNAQSVSHTVLNFLTVLATMNNGVREILPFVRYISQFIEFEFSAIKGQNKGRGVVCAATWIMPAALVPRPWDFDAPPLSAPSTQPTKESPTISEPSDDSDPKTPSDDQPPITIQPSEPSSTKPHVPSPEEVVLTPPAVGALSTLDLV